VLRNALKKRRQVKSEGDKQVIRVILDFCTSHQTVKTFLITVQKLVAAAQRN
jgi:phage-related protein